MYRSKTLKKHVNRETKAPKTSANWGRSAYLEAQVRLYTAVQITLGIPPECSGFQQGFRPNWQKPDTLARGIKYRI